MGLLAARDYGRLNVKFWFSRLRPRCLRSCYLGHHYPGLQVAQAAATATPTLLRGPLVSTRQKREANRAYTGGILAVKVQINSQLNSRAGIKASA
ncbi:unnamed protein product [Periconia digitata]|uniref:Uncharacterized protein n=1 Tax=Periconia digitata TaxID=1303443 RepID=A0A9W4ULC2_9PLEO|nr:unnamed protein product [Periconia digitata]